MHISFLDMCTRPDALLIQRTHTISFSLLKKYLKNLPCLYIYMEKQQEEGEKHERARGERGDDGLQRDPRARGGRDGD